MLQDHELQVKIKSTGQIITVSKRYYETYKDSLELVKDNSIKNKMEKKVEGGTKKPTRTRAKKPDPKDS